jgi:hypothetical protein
VTQAREHRGSLDDSMATAKPCATRAELLARVRESLAPYAREVPDEALHVEPYGRDERIGWDTYLVTIDGYGVWGMTALRTSAPTRPARGAPRARPLRARGIRGARAATSADATAARNERRESINQSWSMRPTSPRERAFTRFRLAASV